MIEKLAFFKKQLERFYCILKWTPPFIIWSSTYSLFPAFHFFQSKQKDHDLWCKCISQEGLVLGRRYVVRFTITKTNDTLSKHLKSVKLTKKDVLSFKRRKKFSIASRINRWINNFCWRPIIFCGTMVQWLSLLHNFFQLSLYSARTQI